MSDVGYVWKLPNGDELWAGEITKARHLEAVVGTDLEHTDDCGCWIILYHNGNTAGQARVLGKALGMYEAREFFTAFFGRDCDELHSSDADDLDDGEADSALAGQAG